MEEGPLGAEAGGHGVSGLSETLARSAQLACLDKCREVG